MTKVSDNTICRSGFTLIEMLTIITIIGLLLSIVMPSLMSVRRQFKRSASLATLKTISGACEAYKTDFGEYPPSNNNDDYGTYLPNWQGRELLPLLLVGYAGDERTPGKPLENGTLDQDDGKDGFGYRMSTRGRVFGPYGGTENVAIKDSANGGHAVFVDSFKNEIYYYRFNDAEGVLRYESTDNSGGPSNINNYAKDLDEHGGDYFTTDFILCTPGPNGKWEAFRDHSDTDDVTNFLREE